MSIKKKLWKNAHNLNTENIFSLLEVNSNAKFLDLGCDEGKLTKKMADKIKTKNIYGVDIIEESLVKARQEGIKTTKADLNDNLPFEDNFFEVVNANQVIEHLVDVDKFAEEIIRILKPGGYAIVSTENLSAWHNIFALLMGRQAFSQHISSRVHVGNPSSILSGEKLHKGWTHNKIFTYFGLKDFFKLYNFKIEKILGAGYYPWPKNISKFLSKIDPRHTHFITVKIRKK